MFSASNNISSIPSKLLFSVSNAAFKTSDTALRTAKQHCALCEKCLHYAALREKCPYYAALREKCPYWELFWSLFYCIWTE